MALVAGGEKDPEQEREQKFLKRYIEYCRAMCSPRLQPKSAKLLEDQYVRYRQEMRERAKKGGAPAVPITAWTNDHSTLLHSTLLARSLARS